MSRAICKEMLLLVLITLPHYCRDIKEQYRTLSMYKIPVPVEESVKVENIEPKWNDLFIQAKNIDRSLVTVKKRFKSVSIIFIHLLPISYHARGVLKLLCC